MFRSKNSLVERWVKADKSDEFVLTKLKLNGLTGNALKTSKNYVYFEHFLKMRDTNRVNTWLAKNVPTYDVWKTLGFDHVRTFMDMKKIAHTDAYQLYLRYAHAFDDHANTNFIQNKVAPTVISSDASWAEKISRTSAWITAGRSEAYVKTVLGLDKLPLNGRYVSTNYQFYMYFQLATLSIHRSLAEHTIFVYLRNAPIHVKLTPEALEIENNLLAYLHLDIVASLTKLSREN
ncbi:RxLR effector protein [Phytophthora megakarya]|uniref:RxLR effector protein n=1 Tax=Phytophthora megakarya TaxID=4795 RepID=A0A225V7K1_9STRA|nr:RxLR effector protein [Phytophthora megakarya]